MQKENSYIEYFDDGRVTIEEEEDILHGTYVITDEDNIKITIEQIEGGILDAPLQASSKFEIDGDEMTTVQNGATRSYRRVN